MDWEDFQRIGAVRAVLGSRNRIVVEQSDLNQKAKHLVGPQGPLAETAASTTRPQITQNGLPF